MRLNEVKEKISEIEDILSLHSFVVMHTFVRNNRRLHLALTDRLRRIAKRGRIRKSKPFLTALKNAEYGFDLQNPRSIGGRDGIFLLDRMFHPPNDMMQRLS